MVDGMEATGHEARQVSRRRRSATKSVLRLLVVLRYRADLESRQLASGTINLRLGAVRRLPYEAADCAVIPPSNRRSSSCSRTRCVVVVVTFLSGRVL